MIRGGENLKPIGNFLKEKNIILKGADAFSREGFVQVPISVLKNDKITDTAKLVYSQMLYYAWHKDYCFPGQERLAKDIKKTDRTIRTAIKNLKDNEFLDVKRRGLNKTNIYILYVKPKK